MSLDPFGLLYFYCSTLAAFYLDPFNTASFTHYKSSVKSDYKINKISK